MPVYIEAFAPTGKTLFATIQRLSDLKYWRESNQTWESSYSYSNHKIALTEGTSQNAGTYLSTSSGIGDVSTFTGYCIVRIHDDADTNDVAIGGFNAYYLEGYECTRVLGRVAAVDVAPQSDSTGNAKVSQGTGSNQLNLSSGRIEASVTAMATDVLSSAAVSAAAASKVAGAVWDLATSGHTTSGTFGNIVGNITSPPSAASIADAVWDETASGHTSGGSFGNIVGNIAAPPSAAAIADAVWDEATSGHSSGGSFGLLLTGSLDAAISSRLATSGYTAPPTAGTIAGAVWDETASGHTSGGSFGNIVGNIAAPPSAGAIADAVWDEATSGHSSGGSFGLLLTGSLDAAVSTRLAGASYTAPPTAATVADTVLSRGVDNVETGADTASLATLILAQTKSLTTEDTWTIFRTDGTTTFATRTLDRDPDTDQVVGIS